MKLSLSLSLLLSCYITAMAQVSIIGGEAIDISEAPYQVSIELENGDHNCGGLILSERWILTAAHCVFSSGLVITSPLLDNLVVHAGSTNQTLDNVGQRINVESIVVHPNYDPPFSLATIEHDIALLYLESPLEFNTNVQPRRYADLCNTQVVDIASGEMASIAGWGATEFSESVANLRFAEIPIVSTAEANTINEQVLPGSGIAVTANNIAFYDSDIQQGSGDSGGPFFIEKNDNSLAVGIVSWSLNPPDDVLAPSIGTNVRVYSGWIESESGISSSTSGLDLFMKDRPWDLGKEPSNVDMGWISDDIWIRNQPDGIENQIHENPEFSLADPVYVYVRVRNRGCIASTGTEQLTLAWAKASTALTWPDNWDGSTTFGSTGPSAGDEIDVQVIDQVIEPGSSTILEFEWDDMPNPADYDLIGNDEPWHFCLLARLVSTDDPMTYPETSLVNDNVIENNNIAWKNVTMIDFSPGLVGNDHYYDAGVVSVGNNKSEASSFEFHFFEENTGEKPIVQEAEIICTLGADLWTSWVDGGMQGTGVSVHKFPAKQIRINAIDAKITNCVLKADDLSTLTLEFAFLTSEATSKDSYDFHLVQKEAGTDQIVGGELFKVVKRNANRYLFQAYAGSTITVVRDELVQLSATSIGEPAAYNWYNDSKLMLYSGFDYSFEADTSMLIILETIADDDGFKDYDQVYIEVLQHYIEVIYPIPTSETMTVSYSINNDMANSAQLEIASQSGLTLQTHVIDITMSNKTVNVSSLPTGVYTVRLLVDGVLSHSKTISKI